MEEGEEKQLAHGSRPQLCMEKLLLVISLFVTFFLVLMSSLWTDSSLFFTFLGFLPLFGTIGFLLFLVENSYKDLVYWATPFLTAFLFLVVFGLLNPFLDYQLNVGGLAVINLLLGVLLVLLLVLIEGRNLLPPVEEVTPDNIDEYMLGIEDKCKALNFVIGRVYRMSNGGTKELRARLRIEKEWYNDFHTYTKDLDQNKDEAVAILHKINDRLQLLMKPENKVLHKKELAALKNLARDTGGTERVIDVLIKNDNDPVEHYYVGAVEGTQKLLASFEANQQ